MAREFNVISTQQVNTFETGPQTLVGSAALLDGGYVVLWETYTYDGLSQEVWGQIFSSSGQTEGANFRVTDRSVLSVTQGDDGGFIVQYSAAEAQLFTSTGDAGELISLDADDWRNHDNVFLLETGNTLTVSNEIRSLPFGESASFIGGHITTPQGEQIEIEQFEISALNVFMGQLHVTSFSDGSFAIAHEGNSNVEFQRFNADGTLDGATSLLDLWNGFEVTALSSDTLAFLHIYEGYLGQIYQSYYGPILTLSYPPALLEEGETGIGSLRIEAESGINYDLIALGEDRLAYFWDTAAGQDSEVFARYVSLISRPDQVRAEGSIAISGTAYVGEELRAETTLIGDENGISDPTFSYQWYRQSGISDLRWFQIAGASEATYTPLQEDDFYSLRVEVSFIDDDGYREQFTSEPTNRVSWRYEGDEQDNVIWGSYGNSALRGYDGNDIIRDYSSYTNGDGVATDDTFWGGNGDDTLISISGNDVLNGENGNDYIVGGEHNSTINGGDGLDTLLGGIGNDFISGGDTELDLRDVIFAGLGDDVAGGGYGNDLIYGQDGNDTLYGGFGSDELVGQNGDDQLSGGALSDLLYGGSGDDFLNGGFGHDRLNGGGGADRFFHLGVFDHGSDWVQAYAASQNDVLVFGGTASVEQFQVNVANTVGAGLDTLDEAFVIYRPTGQVLWALVDGAAQSQILLSMGGEVHDLLA